MSFEKQLVYWA